MNVFNALFRGVFFIFGIFFVFACLYNGYA